MNGEQFEGEEVAFPLVDLIEKLGYSEVRQPALLPVQAPLDPSRAEYCSVHYRHVDGDKDVHAEATGAVQYLALQAARRVALEQMERRTGCRDELAALRRIGFSFDGVTLMGTDDHMCAKVFVKDANNQATSFEHFGKTKQDAMKLALQQAFKQLSAQIGPVLGDSRSLE